MKALRQPPCNTPSVTPGSRDEFVLMLAEARRQQWRARWRAMTAEEKKAETNRKVDEEACPVCGRGLVAAGVPVRDFFGWKSVKATYCSGACKQRAYRLRSKEPAGDD
jgi:hypothetical protein